MPDPQQALAAAVAHIDAGRLCEAEELSRSVLRVDPRSPRALHVLGVVARRMGRLPLAIAVLQDAAAIAPGDQGIHCELGLALCDSQRQEEAVVEYHRALEIDPAYADACLNLAAALDHLERYEEALPLAERAVALAPKSAWALFNLGNVRRAVGMVGLASAAFDAAIKLDPEFAAAHWNQACCRLLAGDFARGWPEYEWRGPAGEVAIDRYPQPRWHGESLAGQTILVHPEQGIGDEILFSSCLPDLIERAGRCVLICDPRLERLFARSFPRASVHGIARRKDRAGAAVEDRIDKQVPAGSLPLYLRPTAESFPTRNSFLVAHPALTQQWNKRLAALGDGLKVGISWRAGGQPSERRKRTTTLAAWQELFAISGVQFVNLQYGETADDITAAARDFGVVIHDWPEADPLVDLDGLAAKMAALDLVISVGNATVHLAGALGVTTWAILPKVPGWRWQIAGDRSPWYPSVRLFRQFARRDWAPVFAELAAELGKLSLSHTPCLQSSRRVAVPASVYEKEAEGNDSPNRCSPGVLGSAPPQHHFDADRAFRAALDAVNRVDLATAESIVSTILEHAPRHAQSLNLLGQIAHRTGRTELAIRSFTRAAAVADNDPTIQFNRATALEQAGRLLEAAEAFRGATALDPAFVDAHFSLAKVLRALGRRAESLTELQETVKLQPNHHKALNLLGGTELEMGAVDDAERSFRAAVALRPDYMAAWNNLGLAIERQGRLNEAMAAYDRAVELDQNCLQAVSNLSNVLERLGQTAAANLVRSQLPSLQAAG